VEWGAMIVDKYCAKEKCPVALRSSWMALRKESLKKTFGIELKNRDSANQQHET
jgi:hypothetical protein